ncbi:Coatomer subunit epsilon (CopE) [Monocercomonoides exilis]|uniref:Coatomer subunit epsilon (CopE) n=1 Tax=Monocercomonoides exilis TaxID=2049356 RepID=UPI00355A6C3A|nr:Coatomer subunit epsilon (CopE) [Monocercomonoides exilis]|eukprot:MONOS_3705.1-p1 / transcript=MONOS_3705.1 / gene=MONOS_3705 / organism=Monocercomonoides_exilis_PA203 / gene_product= Coatomer subunit epsilon (CopE) / transcript_product= Coatomer subunit epsilon (CopE) / location=Mono_scaffold00090:28800-30054(-) / protein_length=315 / sequence_SO=supercontig / SO=protein_coding / is_pseudo=false
MSSRPQESISALRSRFHIGDFTNVIESSKRGKFGEELREEVNVMMYRSMISLGQAQEVLSMLSASDKNAPQLILLKSLAAYFVKTATDEDRKAIVEQFSEFDSDPQIKETVHYPLIASCIFLNEDMYETAYRILKEAPHETLEVISMTISCLLSMNLPAKAAETLTKMKSINPDAALTLLASAMLNLAIGKPEESFQTYQELIEKYGQTAYLVAMLGISQMATGDARSAEKNLTRSLEMQPYNPIAVASLIPILHRSKKSNSASLAARLSQKMLTEYPSHQLSKKIKATTEALSEHFGKEEDDEPENTETEEED